ncbi:MAG: protoheme IX farnesyltransferase [Candidatus Eisenbacteria bacterium]|uniref:Protoheme IX farnesyltransferase n=1 Tax=Eiseniibacteriota bacterium TaxID=2212470 RepID=A0A849SFY0_UNCEI|nr:protoheme IX farnesyltransferase [Candidatus Eisenbacteria bacterium]
MSVQSAPPASLALERPGLLRLLGGYLELTKPRIMLLVLVTAVPALYMAGNGYPGAVRFWGTLLGTALASMSAASFNHWVDRDIDGLMLRTRDRPLPAGLFPASHALAVGFGLAALSWWVLASVANLLAVGLAMASIFYYAVVYSMWLKRRTPQNIVIGGGAGASAPLIAWAAVTGDLALPAVLLAAIVFFWTPPHFWALSLYRREDYLRAGLPMLPVTHGEPETRRQIVLYTLVLVPVTLALGALGVAGPLYSVPAAVLGAIFLFYALRLQRSAATPHAVQLFRYSILYLFLLFVCMTVDVMVRTR